jgi:hypothetical protein
MVGRLVLAAWPRWDGIGVRSGRGPLIAAAGAAAGTSAAAVVSSRLISAGGVGIRGQRVS